MGAVALAVSAGFLFAWAASLQQRAGRASLATPVSGRGRGPLTARLPITGVLGLLVRNPVWLTGWVVNLGGFLTQAVALHRGSVALVQPILVTQLLFTIPITAMHTRRRPSPLDFAAGIAVCAGVALFIGQWGTDPLEGAGEPDMGRALAAVLAALGIAMVLVNHGAHHRPRVRAALASVAAGLCFAVSAVLMKLTIDSLVHEGVAATAAIWPGYLLAVSTVLGLVIGQDALAAGALSIAVAGMAITNPIASAIIGVLAFHEKWPSSAGALAGLAAAGLLLVLGVIGLARSRTIRADTPTGSAEDHTRSRGFGTNCAQGLTR